MTVDGSAGSRARNELGQQTIHIRSVSKRFGGTLAVDDVSLDLLPGKVHALLGENGAGKSTLVKILSGTVRPDSGEASVGGSKIPLGSFAAARKLGVATAFQELSLLPNLTVAENLLLPRLPRGRLGALSQRSLNSQASSILERWNLANVRPQSPVGNLSLADRQRVEIVRALNKEPHLLLLDEPTAALPDVSWLFSHISAVTAEGTAVLYISHRMAELQNLRTSGTVMRNGQVVATFDPETFNQGRLLAQMMGRRFEAVFPPRAHNSSTSQTPLLECRSLVSGNKVKDVSLTVYPGEIVGLAGIEGEGQRELLYAIAGAQHVDGGTILLDGSPARIRSPRQALRNKSKIALVPEDRKSESLFPQLTACANLTLPLLKEIAKVGLLLRAVEYRKARKEASRLNFSREYLDRPAAALSGGNQQKIILGRVLLTGAKVLLLFDPTRGIDAGTKVEIYDLIRKYVAAGSAVLLYSTEIPELVGLCDRVYVIYRGAITKECVGESLKEDVIMGAAVGVKS